MRSCDITRSARLRTPALPWCDIASRILGPTYELSVSFVGSVRARAINQAHRKKDYVPNVLSFSLSKHSGEILLTPAKIKKEARRYGHTYSEHCAYLFIHGCLHLKGLNHGPRMEREEQKALRQVRAREI